MKQITKLLLLIVFIVSTSTAYAASVSLNGTYSGVVYYISGKPIGTGTCYTKDQFPSGSFTLISVKVKGSSVTGKYWNGYSYVKTTGTKTRTGFNLTLKYKLSGYTYDYIIKAASITKTAARINLSGKTNWSKTYGCKYVFSGTVAHSS